jgi:hypothetical protein
MKILIYATKQHNGITSNDLNTVHYPNLSAFPKLRENRMQTVKLLQGGVFNLDPFLKPACPTIRQWFYLTTSIACYNCVN